MMFMMFEEEDVDHQTVSDQQEGGTLIGGRADREIGELPVGDVTSAAEAALSEYLPHNKDQTQKKRRGRPKKVCQLKEVNQTAKNVSAGGILNADPGTFKTPSTSCQQQSTDLDVAFENGSPFDRAPKGITSQEPGSALSSTKQCSDMLMYTVDGEKRVTPKSSVTEPSIQDKCPPFSFQGHNMAMSNTETQSPQGATERIFRKPDKGGGEGRNVVAHTPWISNLTEQDDVKAKNDAGLHPSPRLSQNSLGKKSQGQSKEGGISREQQEKIQMLESVVLTRTSTWTGEQLNISDKFRGPYPSFDRPNVSQREILQSAGEAMKLVDAVVPHEPKVKHGEKGDDPKKSIHSQTQVRQIVVGSKEHDNYCEEDSTHETISSSSFDQMNKKLGKCKMKESDTFSESSRKETGVKEESNKTDVRLMDTNVCKVPSVSLSSTAPDPVTCANEKPKKKIGRPRKKCTNIVTEGTTLGANSSASVKESVESSPKDVGDRKASETTVCFRKKKRGRGRYARKPVCIIPPQEQVVGMEVESTAATPPRKQGSVREVIGRKRVTGTECKESTQLDLKAPAAPTPVIPPPHEQRKRGRRKQVICLNKQTSNSFEPQNLNVSQQVISPPAIKTELEGMTENSTTYSNVKATEKERSAVARQHGEGGSIAVDCRDREANTKLKRKIGRPYKKKTLIKMAKQLALTQVSCINTATATDVYEENQPGNIPFHQRQNDKLKRERKKVELYSQVSQLRRYSRACKLNANYSTEKREHHPGSSHIHLLSSGSNDEIPHLGSGKTSAVLSISKNRETTKSEGRDYVKVTWKKGKHLKNKRKSQVNIKVEEVQQTVLTAFSKRNNPSAFQEILPLVSKEPITLSESVHLIEKKPSKNWEMRSKATEKNQLRFSTESSKSLGTQSVYKVHNDIAAAKDAVPLLIPKAGFEGTTSDTALTENKAISSKGSRAVSMKKFRRKGRMSQKKVTAKIKCEPTLDVALSNASKSHSECDAHSTFLPPSQSESSFSGDKGFQRGGRQCKNEVMIPTVKSSKKVKEEIVAHESFTDQSNQHSQECPAKSPGEVMSCMNISARSEIKRPRKVDRRRKRFRLQKAQELKASLEALIKSPEPVAQLPSQTDNWEDVNSVSQKHSNKRKLETDGQLLNDSDSFTKRPRKAVGSRKRRRRKRSWWDDRGKGKGVLTEKYLDTTLKPSLPSVEGKAEVEVVVKSDFDVKMTADQESITSYKMQNSIELPLKSQLVPPTSGIHRISEELESSGQTSLSAEGTNSEKSWRGNMDSLKSALIDEAQGPLFRDMSSSENQIWARDHDNHDQTVTSSEPLPESPKATVDLVSDELHEKQRMNEAITCVSHTLKDKVSMLDTDSPETDELLKADITGQNLGRSKNREDQQTKIVSNEENILRDDSIMLIPGEVDQVEMDGKTFMSSESKRLNPTNLGSSEMNVEEDVLTDAFLNTPDVEKIQTMSLPQNVAIQDSPQDKRVIYQDGVEQSDQELEEEGCFEEDPVEGMTADSPQTIHSKGRRPGRPPRDKGKKPIECQFCGRPFHHISAYIIHRRVHTGERPYSCQECGKTFAQLSNLNTHRKTHKESGDPHEMFSNEEELLDHLDQKHVQEPQSLTGEMGNEEHEEKNQLRTFPHSKDGKPHICSVCGKGFRYSSMLKIHMRVHSGEKPYSCKICGKSFSQACSVSVHEKIHWSIKPYVCNLCGKAFSQLGTLRTHFYSHTGVYKEGTKHVSNKVTFQCRACDKSFSVWQQYNFHLKSHLDVQFSACDICGQQFRQLSDLSLHRQSCGKRITEESMHHTVASDPLQKSQKQFQPCQLQNSQLQSNYWHQRQGKQIFSTNYSSQPQVYPLPEHKSFPELMDPQPQRDAFQLRNHCVRSKFRQIANPAGSQMIIKSPRKRHPSRHALSKSVRLDRKFDPRKYLCPRCGRLFRHLGRLRAHMLTHVRGHSYTCGRCGKTLENWNKFWLHQRVHRQKRGRFFCPKCGQGFRFAEMYKRHLQEHKELRVLARSSCPQTFSHREALKTHQRDKHKPHKCNVCGKGFHLQGNLQRHNLVHRHTHPECCPHCSLSFPNVSGLKDHMMTHESPTGQFLDMSVQQNLLPYQCGECEVSFENLDLLFRHQLCHSPPRDRKPWCNGEIVGLQKKSPYVSSPLDDTIKYPGSSVPQASAPHTHPSSHQHSLISHTNSSHHSELASNTPSHPSELQSLENNTQLPRTLSPSTAVPFSEAQNLSVPQNPQTSTSVVSPGPIQLQTSPKLKKTFPPKPLRTYEKPKRGVPNAPLPVTPQNEEDSGDSFECAECGAQFNHVPELYEHYLQHARGEL